MKPRLDWELAGVWLLRGRLCCLCQRFRRQWVCSAPQACSAAATGAQISEAQCPSSEDDRWQPAARCAGRTGLQTRKRSDISSFLASVAWLTTAGGPTGGKGTAGVCPCRAAQAGQCSSSKRCSSTGNTCIDETTAVAIPSRGSCAHSALNEARSTCPCTRP